MVHLVLPNHANQLGNLLGGQLMQWMDIAAALVAMRHAGKVCVTAAVDSISFLEPIRVGHIVHILASVNRAFRTSLEVGVKVFREDPINGTRTHAASAYLTFVAIDQYGKPLPYRRCAHRQLRSTGATAKPSFDDSNAWRSASFSANCATKPQNRMFHQPSDVRCGPCTDVCCS